MKKLIQFNVEEHSFRRFKSKLAQRGLTIQKIGNQFIEDVLEERYSLDIDAFGLPSKEPISEMANLDPDLHHLGVVANIHIWSPGKGQPHGPRVKIYKQSIDDGFTVPVLDDLAKMKEKAKGNFSILSQSDVNKVIKNIHRAREIFKEYWINPHMTVGEVSRKVLAALSK
jgi:hypothetical protein